MLPKKIDKKLKFSKFSLKNPINQKYSGGLSGYSSEKYFKIKNSLLLIRLSVIA